MQQLKATCVRRRRRRPGAAGTRWCWRQSAQSATRETTTDALVVVEGLHDGAERDVAAAREEIVALLGEFQPGATVA